MDSHSSILTSHLQTLLALHTALFLPCSSILSMTLTVPKSSYNAIVSTLRQKYSRFMDAIAELQKVAENDSYGCIYRGDVYTSMSHIHDTPENMAMFFRILSVLIFDAEKECDVCSEGMNAHSLIKSYAVICSDTSFIQAYFNTSLEDELCFDDVCEFFDRFYRIHSLLFKCFLTPLSRQRLAALHTQTLFEEVNAIFTSVVTLDDLSNYLHTHKLLWITEHPEIINARDGYIARRLSADPSVSLPAQPAIREVNAMEIKNAIPVVGHRILPATTVDTAVPLAVPTATAIPTAVPATTVPTAAPIIPSATALSSGPIVPTSTPLPSIRPVPTIPAPSTLKPSISGSNLNRPPPPHVSCVENSVPGDNPQICSQSHKSPNQSALPPPCLQPPTSYPQPPNPCSNLEKPTVGPSSCPLGYTDLRDKKDYAKPPTMTLHTGDGYSTPLPSYRSPLMSPRTAIPDVSVAPSLSSSVPVVRTGSTPQEVPTVPVSRGNTSQEVPTIPVSQGKFSSESEVNRVPTVTPLPSLTAEAVPTIYSEVSIPLTPLPSETLTVTDHILQPTSLLRMNQTHQTVEPTSLALTENELMEDERVKDEMSRVLSYIQNYRSFYHCNLMELDTLLQKVTTKELSIEDFLMLTKPLGSQDINAFRDLYFTLDKMRQNTVNPRHIRAVIQLIIKKPLLERLKNCVCVACEVTENAINTQDFVALIPMINQFLMTTILTFYTYFQPHPFDPQVFINQNLPVHPTMSVEQAVGLLHMVIQEIEKVLEITEQPPSVSCLEEWKLSLNMNSVAPEVLRGLLLEESRVIRFKEFIQTLRDDECMPRIRVLDLCVLWFEICQVTPSPTLANLYAQKLFDAGKKENQTVHVCLVVHDNQ